MLITDASLGDDTRIVDGGERQDPPLGVVRFPVSFILQLSYTRTCTEPNGIQIMTRECLTCLSNLDNLYIALRLLALIAFDISRALLPLKHAALYVCAVEQLGIPSHTLTFYF